MTIERPTCSSCPHFFRENAQGNGHCRFLPPTAFLQISVNRLNPQQMQESLKSAHPPQTADKWCGQHPDFLRWWSAHREEFAATAALREATVEGQA